MPAIQFSGLASGLDTESIVGAILQVERIPNQRLEQQNYQLESQNKILDRLTGALSNLASKAKALETSRDFLSYTAQSSNEGIAKMAVSGEASPGNYELKVLELASSQRNYSKSYANLTDAASASGSDQELTISVGGSDTSITLSAGESLKDLAAKINRSGADVTAGIFQGADGARLQIVGNKTGAENSVTFSGSAGLVEELGLNDNLVAEAKDARATLDGFEITSSTNTFASAMPGVSLEVFEVQDESDPAVNLRVAPDPGSVKDKIKGLASAYNDVINLVNEQSGEGKGASTLSGDSTVRMVQSRLSQALHSVSSELKDSDGHTMILANIGLTTNAKTGTLSVNSSAPTERNPFTLTGALDSDFEGVARHFTGDIDLQNDENSVKGLSGRILQAVQELTGINASSVSPAASGEEGEEDDSSSSDDTKRSAGKDSIIGARKAGIQRRIDDNKDRISSRELYLENYEKQLRMQYAALEEMMSQLQSQGNYLAQFGR